MGERQSAGASARDVSPLTRLPPAERPRERLWRDGPERLADRDLIAILLGTGRRTRSALEVADEVLLTFGGLAGVGRALPAELSAVPGVGRAKATAVAAAFELGRRLGGALARLRPQVANPRDVAGLVMDELLGAERERFYGVLLDARRQLVSLQLVAVGHLTGAPVHPRELFRECIRRGAVSVILVHNHPSGDPSPSDEDIQITRRLVEAGDLLGIPVDDHVIVAGRRYVSLREAGLM